MHSPVLWTISSTCPFGVHKLLRFFCKLSFYFIIFVQETDARLKLILNIKISTFVTLVKVFWISFYYLECRQFRVSIEFSLEHPEGGIQFVIPKGEGTMAQVVKKALYSLFVYFYVVLLMSISFKNYSGHRFVKLLCC